VLVPPEETLVPLEEAEDGRKICASPCARPIAVLLYLAFIQYDVASEDGELSQMVYRF
jgi:hypothetical protein